MKNKKLEFVMLVLVLSFMLAGCGTPTPSPVTFPVATGSPPFKLIVDKKQGNLTYAIECTAIDRTTKLTVTFRHKPSSSFSPMSSPAADCAVVGRELSSGPLIEMSQLRPGDDLSVAIEVQPAGYPTPQGFNMTAIVFKVGVDGKLYPGDPNLK